MTGNYLIDRDDGSHEASPKFRGDIKKDCLNCDATASKGSDYCERCEHEVKASRMESILETIDLKEEKYWYLVDNFLTNYKKIK
jgi:methionyl-tRNA synthetase